MKKKIDIIVYLTHLLNLKHMCAVLIYGDFMRLKKKKKCK